MVKSTPISSPAFINNDGSKQPSTRERGASLVEYSLLVALIAAVSIGAVTTLGEHAQEQFAKINQELE